jgi:hypothetical protein
MAQLPDQPPDFLLLQTRQGDRRRVRLGPEHPTEPGRRRVALHLTQCNGTDPEHRRVREPPGEETEQVAAVLVAPVKVVHGDHHRLLGGQRRQYLGHALEYPPRLPWAGRRFPRGHRREALPQLGKQPSGLGQPLGGRAGQPGGGEGATKGLDDRGEGDGRGGVVSPSPQRDGSLRHHVAHELIGQPGLADPGLTLQQDDAPLPPADRTPGLLQVHPLPRTPDQAAGEGRGPGIPFVADRTGGRLGAVRLDAADEREQVPRRFTPGLALEQGAVLREPGQRGAAVAGEKRAPR